MVVKSPSLQHGKSWGLSLLQLGFVVGIAFFAFQHVLTTGQVNRIFFHPSQRHSDHGPPSGEVPTAVASTVAVESTATAKKRAPSLPAPTLNRTVSTNYFNLALEGYFDNTTIALEDNSIKPIEVMKLYLEQHSQSVLKQEDVSVLQNDRKYLVAWYACPQHAGRRLHSLLNSLAWAVSTNRTLLVGYLNQEQCEANPGMWNKVFVSCNATNTEQQCDKYMTLQDWVPRLEEWSSVLGIKHNMTDGIIRADGVTTRDAWARPMDQEEAPQFIHIGVMQMNLIAGIDLTRPNQRGKLLSQTQNRERAKSLFFYGYYFCYGMLLEALVTLQGVAAAAPSRSTNGLQSLSVALHSRHPRPEHEPAYTNLESICIRQLVKVHPNNESCTVYIMSDSVERYEQLEAQIEDIGCQAQRGISTDHDKADQTTMDAAFFDDWILLRDSVRHGFMAPHRKLRQGIGMRPSSALLREAVEFRRVLEGHHANMPHECFSRHDWDMESSTTDTNCTPIERLASSFGLERYQQLHGIIRDPCVWKTFVADG